MNRRFKREVIARLGSLAVIIIPLLLIVVGGIIATRHYGLGEGPITAIVFLAIAWSIASSIFVGFAWNNSYERTSVITDWIDEEEKASEDPKDPRPMFL